MHSTQAKWFIYWIYPYDIVIATNAHNILIHNGHEAMNFILSFTILVFYAHGGEIEFVPLEATNYCVTQIST